MKFADVCMIVVWLLSVATAQPSPKPLVRQEQLGVYGHRIDKNNIHHRWLTVIDDDQGVDFVMPDKSLVKVWRRGGKILVHCDGKNIVVRGIVTNQMRLGFFEDDEEDTWGYAPTRMRDPFTKHHKDNAD